MTTATAEPLLREALDIFHLTDEPNNRYRAIAVRVLSDMLAERDVPAESIPLAIEAVELARVAEGGRHLPDAVRDLGNMVWHVAREPDRHATDYRIALEGIEAALTEQPEDAAFINTRGVLLYRLGDDQGALDTLARSHAFYCEQYETGVPADLAFMAMAHHRLGHDSEARETLAQLRQAMETPELACTEDNKRHSAEAEAMLDEPGPNR